MAASLWIEKIRQSEKTCIIQDGKRLVHYKFSDGQEMAEEYDFMTWLLTGRKWREKTTFGGVGQWIIEIGQPMCNPKQMDVDGIKENQQNPCFYRLDTESAFQWRIRNIPYPLDNYDVTVDDKAKQIVVKTLNKKYYKKFSVPDLDRCSLAYDGRKLSLSHKNNILIIQYEKPEEILQMEATLRDELQKLKARKVDDDSDCRPS